MTIGELARRSGVGVETIRFYQREGLIVEPPRRGSAYRRYTEDVVRHVRFIRRAKDLGFTLDETRDLLLLRVEPGASCEDVRVRALAKLADIDEKVRSLERMKVALRELTEACSGDGSAGACPILDALDPAEDAS